MTDMTEFKYAGYKRDEASYFNMARGFSDDKLRTCPFCGNTWVKWRWKEEFQILQEQYAFFGRMYHFLCPECESILKIREGDVTGYACTKSTLEGMLKKSKGKELSSVYVIVEKVGDCLKNEQTAALEGKEFSLQELKGEMEKLNHKND